MLGYYTLEVGSVISITSIGESHDQADAEGIVIRTQLRGHNNMPFGRPAPGRPSGRPSGVFCMFSYYLLVMLFIIMVCLTVGLAWSEPVEYLPSELV
jgi:hypothetical protein